MMNKAEFRKSTISTTTKEFGKKILNRAYEKNSMTEFIRAYVEDKYGATDKSLEKNYREEYDADVTMIENAAESFDYAMIGTGESVETQLVQNGFFVKLYSEEVPFRSDGYDLVRDVLVVVPIIPKF